MQGDEGKEVSRLVQLGSADDGSVVSDDIDGITLVEVGAQTSITCSAHKVLLSLGFLALGTCLGLMIRATTTHRQSSVHVGDDGGQNHSLQNSDFLKPTASAGDFLDQVDTAAQEKGASVVVPIQENVTLPPLPPLSDLLKRNKIKGDISWMLDFSIADFPKAGTTFLMYYLRRSEEIYMNKGEVCYLDRRFPSQFVTKYYEPHLDLQNRQTEDGHKMQFGLKCPEELETEYGLDRYSKYFPDMKFIVSLRHPVSWFESYYNFRVYKRYPLEMPPTKDLIGPCKENYAYVQWNCSVHCHSGKQNVCTNRGNFHWALSRLGKTPMSTPEEKELLQHKMAVSKMPSSKIFLVENRQLLLENPASQNFTSDLRDFLGLHHDLKPLMPYVPVSPEERYPVKEAYEKRINICDEEHNEVRLALVEIGRNAAKWIQEYFIESPDVVVTSKDLFTRLLDDWGDDPCNEGARHRTLLDTPE